LLDINYVFIGKEKEYNKKLPINDLMYYAEWIKTSFLYHPV
jgi:hypothetical protein